VEGLQQQTIVEDVELRPAPKRDIIRSIPILLRAYFQSTMSLLSTASLLILLVSEMPVTYLPSRRILKCLDLQFEVSVYNHRMHYPGLACLIVGQRIGKITFNRRTYLENTDS
jgi:hypothetical protein